MPRTSVVASLLLVIASSAWASGCSSGRDRRVPFRGAEQAGASATPPVRELAPIEVLSHPDGTHAVDLDGSVVRIDEGSIRASAVFDFDRDGDRDVLLVVLDAPRAAARVFYGERRGAELAPLVSLASLASIAPEPGDAGCRATSAAIVPLSEALVLASVEASCEDATRPRLSSAWVLSADERPRALEILRFAGQTEGEGLSFAARDRDQDGHDDLEVEVRVRVGEASVTTTLVWMNRPAGLAREGTAPDPTFTALAEQALSRARSSPEEAIAATAQGIALREAICRDAERPRLWIGGARGVPCDASAAVGRLYALRAGALAGGLRALDDVEAVATALDAFIDLDHEGVALRAGDRGFVREAWMRLASIPPPLLEVHRHPADQLVPQGASPRLSSLAFVGEDELVVRGAEPRALRVEGDALVPSSAPLDPTLAELAIVDTARALRLEAIERSCDGIVLVVGASGEPAEVAGGGRREYLVAPRTPPFAASCPNMPPGLRADDGGFVALGWSPSGVVLAHGARVVLVPIGAGGEPLGAPTPLEEGTPLPAPLPEGAAVRDAHAYALAFPFGIVVVDRAARAVRVFRDADFSVPAGRPIDVALAPSGSRAAWICGDAICWADLRASAARPAPSSPPEGPPRGARQRRQEGAGAEGPAEGSR